MSTGDTLLYVVLPYVSLTILVVGLIWRWKTDTYGWNARSTQLLEGRTLRYGGVLFHVGALAAIGGHIMGILIPKSWTEAVGLSDAAYHVIAVIGGVTAGLAVTVGLAILIYRRIRFPRVRTTTKRMDVAVFALLTFGIVTGFIATLMNIPDTVHYRETVAPYFRQIFIFDPDPSLMTEGDVPLVFQLHVIGAWFLFALWPFSRLVHAFSVPVQYLRRSPIPYRARGNRETPESSPQPRAVR